MATEPASPHLTDAPLDLAATLAAAGRPGHGAVVLFVGTVRDHHGERAVEAITYTAYRRLADSALARIARELEAETPGLVVSLCHRLGRLAVGEASVVIATSAPHRDAAYLANRQALERIKREVAIWKHEHYRGGDSAWREIERLPTPGGPSGLLPARRKPRAR